MNSYSAILLTLLSATTLYSMFREWKAKKDSVKQAKEFADWISELRLLRWYEPDRWYSGNGNLFAENTDELFTKFINNDRTLKQ